MSTQYAEVKSIKKLGQLLGVNEAKEALTILGDGEILRGYDMLNKYIGSGKVVVDKLTHIVSVIAYINRPSANHGGLTSPNSYSTMPYIYATTATDDEMLDHREALYGLGLDDYIPFSVPYGPGGAAMYLKLQSNATKPPSIDHYGKAKAKVLEELGVPRETTTTTNGDNQAYNDIEQLKLVGLVSLVIGLVVVLAVLAGTI